MKIHAELNLKIISFLFIFCFLLLPVNAEASRLHPERFYQEIWCQKHNGVVEHILPDKTRVDCLTRRYAIEFDFANKFYQAIGQALFYSEMTGLKPGIVLIMEDPEKDYKYLIRLLIATQSIPRFRIWVIQ